MPMEPVKHATRSVATRAVVAGTGSATMGQDAFQVFAFDGNLTITAQAQ